jgi:hypothetical protein
MPRMVLGAKRNLALDLSVRPGDNTVSIHQSIHEQEPRHQEAIKHDAKTRLDPSGPRNILSAVPCACRGK